MSKSPSCSPNADTGAAARRFFVVQELLSTPELARFYIDLLINSPTIIPAVRERQGLSKSTAYKYANRLEELGIAEELDQHEEGSSVWRTDPVVGVWNDDATVTLGPASIAVYGATGVDDDLKLFVDRHGKAALAPAIIETIEYLRGNRTRRGVADALGVPVVEGIAVSQSIERILVVVQDADPSLSDTPFEVEVHDRALEHAPYQRAVE